MAELYLSHFSSVNIKHSKDSVYGLAEALWIRDVGYHSRDRDRASKLREI